MGKQSGFLMMVVAILLVIIGGLAISFVAMTVSSTNSSISIMTANNAYDLAETGIEHGSYQLSLGTCNSSWSSSVTLTGQGQYQYNCTQNIASTTVTSNPLSAIATTIPVASAAGLDTFGAITIDSEIIYYDGKSGNNLLNAQRGKNNTTATTHSFGAGVSQSQYLISSQAGAPSLADPNGMITLTQAVLVSLEGVYYAVGTQGSTGVILSYNKTGTGAWVTERTNSGFTFRGVTISANYGLAVGSESNNSTIYDYDGNTWSFFRTVNSTNFWAVSCNLPNNPTQCWIGGQKLSPATPIMYNPVTGAAPYTNVNVGNLAIDSVSCISNICRAATSDEDVFTFAVNSTNPLATPVTVANNLNAINCPGTNSCLAVRNNGSVHSYNGSWSIAYDISNRALRGVYCPSTSNCIVVGNNGTIFNCNLPVTSTSSCTAQTTPGTIDLKAVHCITATDCLAVGIGNTAYHYTAGTWTSVSLPTNYTLNSVSGVVTGVGTVVTPTVFHNQ